MNSRIVKIVPYFGKLPKYWPYYVKSLAFNKEYIDLLFITDIDLPEHPQENIRVIKMSKDELFNLVEKKTGYTVAPEARYPYKLCDFKPLFGHVFEDEITDYAFWAYGDIDMIYGDFSRYLKPRVLKDNDVISFIESILCASLCVFRNTKQLREFYRNSPDVQKVLSTGKIMRFDEAGAKGQYLLDGDTMEEAVARNIPGDITCFSSMIFLAAERGELKMYARQFLKESLPFDEVIEYRNGKIIIGGGVERIAYHFVTEKKLPKNIVHEWQHVPDHYYISTTGTYTAEQMKYFGLLHALRGLQGWSVLFKKRIKDSINFRLKK